MTSEQQLDRLEHLIQQATSARNLLRSGARTCKACQVPTRSNYPFVIGDFTITDRRPDPYGDQTLIRSKTPSRSDSGKSTATNANLLKMPPG